jgi:hypothetical protein
MGPRADSTEEGHAMNNLPVHRHSADCGCYAPEDTPYQQRPTVIEQHYHAAPQPDRVVQRAALGTGIGAGAVAAGVYFGPLLVAALSSIAITLAVTAVCLAVAAWAVVTVVRAVGGQDGRDAADTLRRRRR